MYFEPSTRSSMTVLFVLGKRGIPCSSLNTQSRHRSRPSPGRPGHPRRLDPDAGRGSARGRRLGAGTQPRGLLPRGDAHHARHPGHLDPRHPALHRRAQRCGGCPGARRLGRDGAHAGGISHRSGRPRALPGGHRGRGSRGRGRLVGQDAPGVQEPARDAGRVDPGSADLCRSHLGRGSRARLDPRDAPEHLGRPLRALGSDDAARKAGADRRGDARRPLLRRRGAAATWC